ncbi:hypothetical protein [uncultured Nostoc sp.]|uniref:hypothetical protein n=1 Tax=uncultured Nostoc sp. TaxID=340711 RepID=UPI0035CA4A7C
MKGIILGIDNILATGKEDDAQIDSWILNETGRLINFLQKNGIQPIVLANRDWFLNGQRLKDFFTNKWGDFQWFIANIDGTPHKPSKDSINHVLSVMGWNKNETVYLGNTDADMKTAVNGGLLFLNATWYEQTNYYGFEFTSPLDVARFVDIFCLRENLWHYCINHQGLEFYSLGTYGFLEQKYAVYSQDAKEAAKNGRGHPDFWIKYLLSTVYFSGMHERIDYIAPYPGHQQGGALSVMEEATIAFAKCFRKKYLKDLIIRHTTSIKSSSARNSGKSLDHLNQLNTIMLNDCPSYGNDKTYKKSPLKSGKAVLVLDDICTEGYSFEAARAYIKQTGAEVICLSLLKTIVKDYRQIVSVSSFNPFEPNQFTSISEIFRHPYNNYISSPLSHEEIGSKLQAYDNWQWPNSI